MSEQEQERDLVELYDGFKLPALIEEQYKHGMSPFGARGNALFVFFASRVGLSNEDYDKYAAIKPERQENETYEYYKKRQKLQKMLAKRKPFFYDYSVYNKN